MRKALSYQASGQRNDDSTSIDLGNNGTTITATGDMGEYGRSTPLITLPAVRMVVK